MIEGLAQRVRTLAEGRDRVLIGIAGPPGAGKSTLAAALGEALGPEAAVVPMDGFHLDNAVLDRRGLRAVKGAPETFDAAGFVAMLARLRECEAETLVPVFDREADLARAGALAVTAAHRLVLVEGNYLLLKRPGWDGVAPLLDFSLMLDVPLNVLEDRLVRRWLDHGLNRDEALTRARGNDLANARLVLEGSLAADLVVGDAS